MKSNDTKMTYADRLSEVKTLDRMGPVLKRLREECAGSRRMKIMRRLAQRLNVLEGNERRIQKWIAFAESSNLSR